MQDRVNQKWRDAMALLGRHFTNEERAAGWPESFKPERIAVLQRPFKNGDSDGRKLVLAYRDGLNAAVASGKLTSTTKTERVVDFYKQVFQGYASRPMWGGDITKPVYGNEPVHVDKEFHYITALAFAAWLAAQGETPSVHIQAWFDAVGVAGAGQAAPVVETIPQRNARWLALVDKAQAGPTKTSDTAIFKQIEDAEGISWETVKKAVAKAKKDRNEQYREGNVKPLARGKKGKANLNNVWGNRIEK